jgi:hypothetical protein
MDGNFHPFAAAGDDRQHRGFRVRNPPIVLKLSHVLFHGGFFRECPGEHELGFEYRAGRFDYSIQCRCHPFVDRMLDPPLSILGATFIPAPIEVLSDGANLDDQVIGEIPQARLLRASRATSGSDSVRHRP